MGRRLAYVLNPAAAAGRALNRWAALREPLRQRGLHGREFLSTRPGDAVALATQAAREADLVVAVGGDGTVSEVANGLLRSGAPAPLAILPLGTGNDIAAQLGIRTPAEALELLDHGQVRRIDAIRMLPPGDGDHVRTYALSFVSVGFAGELLRQTTPTVKRWCGPRWCYSVGFLRALATYQAPHVRIQADSGVFDGRWLHIGVGNFEWAGGGAMRLSPGARCDDGEFDVCLVEAVSRCEAAWHFPKLLRGTFVGHRRVRYFRSRELILESRQPETLQVDGDLRGDTPVRLTLQARCLPVLTAP